MEALLIGCYTALCLYESPDSSVFRDPAEAAGPNPTDIERQIIDDEGYYQPRNLRGYTFGERSDDAYDAPVENRRVWDSIFDHREPDGVAEK